MEIFADFETWTLGTKAYFAVALFATLTLLVQIVLLAFGFGDGVDAFDDISIDTDLDIDVDSGHDLSGVAGITYFSISSITAFCCFFGWTGFLSVRSGIWGLPAFVLALIAGAAALFAVAWMLSMIRRLNSRGNVNVKTAIGEIGRIYLTIPAGENKTGAVIVTASGRRGEYQAVSEQGEEIQTNARVKVTGLLDSRTLIVTPVNKASDWEEKGL